MKVLSEFQQLVLDYTEVADFIIVYTSEAHPTDGWLIHGNKYTIQQHRTLAERCAAAQTLKNLKVQCPIVVDNMWNEAAGVHTSWPEKLVILQQGRIAYMGKRGPWGHKISEVKEWLEQYVENKKEK